MSWSHRQGDFVQVFGGEKVQSIAFAPRADEPVGAFPIGEASRVALEGLEIGRAAENPSHLCSIPINVSAESAPGAGRIVFERPAP